MIAPLAADLNWMAVSILVLILIVILLWGMRRDEKGNSAARGEIAADDPEPQPRQHGIFQGDYHGSNMMEDRRYLRSLWGPDTPDLVVGFWRSPRDASPRNTSFRQMFLPIEGGWDHLLSSIEQVLFESSEVQEVPAGSLLASAWCFIQIPGIRDDLAILTRFSDGEFHHTFHRVDSEGLLHVFQREELDLGSEGTTWENYRLAVSLCLRKERPDVALEILHELGSAMESRGEAHGWLAAMEHQNGRDPGMLARHLSISREFAPGNLHARLLKARLLGPELLGREIRRLDMMLLSNTDRRVQTGFLLAQSLHALDHGAAARELCGLILAEAPRHSATSRLVRLIDQRERGAQT